jgi:Flp pilus assembly protein TadG
VRENGSTTVELALLIPIILLLIAMVVEVALAARLQIELVSAAREGARVAATTPDPAAAAAAVQSALGERGAEVRINVHRPHVVGVEATVTVWATHQVRLPLIGGPSVPFRARAVMRVER